MTSTPGSSFSRLKTVAGDFFPGGTIFYTVTITNRGPTPQLDNPGPEFEDVLPPALTLISASATSGVTTVSSNINTVTWNGTLAANGGQVVITIQAGINPNAGGTVVVNQGTLFVDTDGDGVNEGRPLTDDPSPPGSSDPTIFNVALSPPAPVPFLTPSGIALALIFLCGIAASALRRRGRQFG